MRSIAYVVVALTTACLGAPLRESYTPSPSADVSEEPAKSTVRDAKHFWFCIVSEQTTSCMTDRSRCISLLRALGLRDNGVSCQPTTGAVCYDYTLTVQGTSGTTCMSSLDECFRRQRVDAGSPDYSEVGTCTMFRTRRDVAPFTCYVVRDLVGDCYRDPKWCAQARVEVGASDGTCQRRTSAHCFTVETPTKSLQEDCSLTNDLCEKRLAAETKPIAEGCVERE